ncbi:MAG: hypothetical protein MRY74_15225 [Neomegalonema sp.]|nr:hypothetical protein [Neomegalonema sp.]
MMKAATVMIGAVLALGGAATAQDRLTMDLLIENGFEVKAATMTPLGKTAIILSSAKGVAQCTVSATGKVERCVALAGDGARKLEAEATAKLLQKAKSNVVAFFKEKKCSVPKTKETFRDLLKFVAARGVQTKMARKAVKDLEKDGVLREEADKVVLAKGC